MGEVFTVREVNTWADLGPPNTPPYTQDTPAKHARTLCSEPSVSLRSAVPAVKLQWNMAPDHIVNPPLPNPNLPPPPPPPLDILHQTCVHFGLGVGRQRYRLRRHSNLRWTETQRRWVIIGCLEAELDDVIISVCGGRADTGKPHRYQCLAQDKNTLKIRNAIFDTFLNAFHKELYNKVRLDTLMHWLGCDVLHSTSCLWHD
ncbi:unnamed protein product [Gadus morhua 'NCC']